MIYGIITLLVALSLSAVSAFYSVIGLTAIFSGEFVAVFIMGSILEVGKLVTASWLYRNWSLAPKYLKIYLTSALMVLMLITSLGIFGFLSKAHLESSSNINNIETVIANIDSEIATKNLDIEAVRKSIANLDTVIQQYYQRGRLKQGSVELTQQEAARTKLEDKIKSINTEILELQKKKNEVNTNIRNERLKVGPIKYVAQLIYGNDSDEKQLEKAIQYLILLIIFTFDPLAVLLLIAANISLVNAKKEEDNSEIAHKMKTIKIASTKDGKTWGEKEVKLATDKVRYIKDKK